MNHSKLERRLRKKHHLGEFTEYGFEVSINPVTNLSEKDFYKFIDDFIDVIETNKLLLGGGGNSQNYSGFVTSSQKYQSPTELQKNSIKNWLENCQTVSICEIGDFIDA